VHRVFPSSYNTPASSREIQFHWVIIRDSKAIVTSFMQDGTYPSRNFATLGLSELQPPFTEVYIKCVKHLLFTEQHRADVKPYTSYFYFAEFCVFNKQSLLSFFCNLQEITNHFTYIFKYTYKLIFTP